MDDKVKEIELAAGTEIPGDKIKTIVLKEGYRYALPEKKPEGAAKPPAADKTDEPKDDDARLVSHFGEEKAKKLKEALGDEAFKYLPPKESKPGEKKPEETDQSTELKADLEEVNAVKEILAKKILQSELSSTPELKVEDRMAELMKLKLNDLTKLLPKAAPDQRGEGYATGVALSSGGQKPKEVKTLRDLVEIGVDGGVL